MEETGEVTQVVLSENITSMDPIFCKAAFEGNMNAFKEKDSEEIERMLTPNQNTILHIHLTSYTVSESFVEGILHMCPALLMKPNVKGETLVHIAARYGHVEIVTKLIRKSTMLIRAVDKENNTALHEAVRFHHTEIVHILTKEDPHYSYFGNSDGETPLYMAAERDYEDVVIKILENCESPNQDGPNGRTALHAAVIRNNQEMVSKLLEKSNSQVKKADENGWIPLHLAALDESADLTEKLLKSERSTAYMRDKRGRTALHLAAQCMNGVVVTKIIEYCPDCAELVDENGFNFLHYTASRKYIPYQGETMEKALLSNLYNEKDNNGNTPLHHLAKTQPELGDLAYEKLPQRLDAMAFNKKNQTAIDVAYENLPPTSASELYSQKVYLGSKLLEFGVKYGGRMITVNKNERKMIKTETHKQGSESSIRETTKNKQEEIKEDKDEKSFLNMLDTSRETYFVVATLITTVTFAAGFTLPGGLIQEFDQPEKGSPILKHNQAFQAFVIIDSISFVLSSSAMLLLCLSSSIFGIKEDSDSYEKFIDTARVLTLFAMVFLVIAFVTGTYAVLGASSKGLAIVTLLIGLSFFFGFVVFRCLAHEISTTQPEEEQQHFPEPDRAILQAKDIQLSDFESVGLSAYPKPKND